MRTADILKKYKTYVANMKWHTKTNKPKGEEKSNIEARISCYEEIVSDLEKPKPTKSPNK